MTPVTIPSMVSFEGIPTPGSFPTPVTRSFPTCRTSKNRNLPARLLAWFMEVIPSFPAENQQVEGYPAGIRQAIFSRPPSNHPQILAKQLWPSISPPTPPGPLVSPPTHPPRPKLASSLWHRPSGRRFSSWSSGALSCARRSGGGVGLVKKKNEAPRNQA